MEITQALVLSTIQGLTEWFPISSSAHLVIAQEFLGIKASVTFDVMLHLGTLLAVIYFLRKELVKILKLRKESKKLLAYIIISSLPIALFGLLFKNILESFFSSLLAVGLALIVNGFILYSTKFFSFKRELKLFDAFLIGLAQVFSLFPGISRSGITISTALIRGIDKKVAYKFSFLISIIPILGASLIKSGEINLSQEPIEIILLGVLFSAFVGYIALKTIAKTILEGRFYKFAYYCWTIGLILLILTF